MTSNLKEFAPNIDLDDVYQAKDIIAIAKEAAQMQRMCMRLSCYFNMDGPD